MCVNSNNNDMIEKQTVSGETAGRNLLDLSPFVRVIQESVTQIADGTLDRRSRVLGGFIVEQEEDEEEIRRIEQEITALTENIEQLEQDNGRTEAELVEIQYKVDQKEQMEEVKIEERKLQKLNDAIHEIRTNIQSAKADKVMLKQFMSHIGITLRGSHGDRTIFSVTKLDPENPDKEFYVYCDVSRVSISVERIEPSLPEFQEIYGVPYKTFAEFVPSLRPKLISCLSNKLAVKKSGRPRRQRKAVD